MRGLKKFWIVFLSMLPFTAGAVSPLLIGGLAGLGVMAGFSIYRTAAPVNMHDAMNFFSTCWSCQMFSDVMAIMSGLVPRAYSAIGTVILPMTAGLLMVWAVWQLTKGFLNATVDKPWETVGTFSSKLIKFAVIGALVVAPLPRMVTDIFIEPVFNVGLSMNQIIAGDDAFDKCVVATAIADPVAGNTKVSNAGAFSPRLRHNLACELASVHQMTAMGLTVGWTMANMAFDYDHMHKILWFLPLFPNVILLFGGLLIMILFFFALLPVPMYFLQVFITLSMDLIMLPLMLMSWVFGDWKILPKGGSNIREIVDSVIKSTAGIALVGIFITFSVMFLNAVFGDADGASLLATAIQSGDSKMLIDGLMMKNDSLITIVMIGIFLVMFMTSIPALVQTLFSNVKIPKEFYETTKKNIDNAWKVGKKWWGDLKK